MSHIESELERVGLKKQAFVGKAGDVLIWHSQLFHGGMPILDAAPTRKTLVVHYWRKEDIGEGDVVTTPNGGLIMNRDHLTV